MLRIFWELLEKRVLMWLNFQLKEMSGSIIAPANLLSTKMEHGWKFLAAYSSPLMLTIPLAHWEMELLVPLWLKRRLELAAMSCVLERAELTGLMSNY